MSYKQCAVLPLIALALGILFGGCAPQKQTTRPSQRPMNEPQPSYLEHTITFSGETLADIAAWYTGKATNWQAIRDANPSVRPDRLRLGQMILVPRTLVINDRPFTKAALKRNPNKGGEMTPTPAPADGETIAAPTPTPSTLEETALPIEPTPFAEATAAPVDVTPVPTATPGPTSDDLEREKLLDELLK